MAIDASIYGNLRPIQQVEMPDFASSISKAMTLRQMAMQAGEQERANADKEAIRAAYSRNVDPSGKLNQAGVLSDLAKSSPAAMMQMQEHFNKADKGAAELQASKADAIQKTYNITGPAFDYMAKMPEAQRAAAYPQVIQQLKEQGVDVSRMEHPYDPADFQRYHGAWLQNKESLANQIAKGTIGKQPLEQEKLQAEVEKLRGEGKEVPMKLAGELRKERAGLPTTKATQEISAAYNKIQNAARDPSAAGDMSMIFGYMKLLDPGSTVREGEQASAQQAAGVPAQVLNAYNRALTGQRLAPEQRADFLNQARGLYSAQMSQQNKVDKDYERLALRAGANPDDVLMNFGADEPTLGPVQPRLAGGGQGKGAASLLETKEAQAASRPAPPMIRMMAPDGTVRSIPLSKKGEAIAAGGKVVK